MSRFQRSASLPALLLLAVPAGYLGMASVGLAEEFRFVVHDVENNLAAWAPPEIAIPACQDQKEDVVFVLENTTPRTHVFEAPGLFELVAGETGDMIAKPLRITVAAEETMRVHVSAAQLTESAGAGGELSYHYFCPLHKGDSELGSTLRVVPRVLP